VTATQIESELVQHPPHPEAAMHVIIEGDPLRRFASPADDGPLARSCEL
jgi:hypothetical protein